MVTGEKATAVAELRVADPQFSSATASQYTLLLNISLQGIAYGLLHVVDNSFTAASWLPFNGTFSTNSILELLSGEPLLQNRFKQVRISLPAIQYSLVPEELFDLKELNTYISFEQDSDIARQLFADKVNEQIRLVYSVDLRLRNELKSMFLSPIIYSAPTAEISQALRDFNKAKTDTLLVKELDQSIQVIALSNGQLKMMNQYQTTTPEDVVYFLLSLTEQLAFNTDSVEMVYSNTSDLLSEIATYFKHTRSADRPKGINYHDRLAHIPGHVFHNLFSLATCA